MSWDDWQKSLLALTIWREARGEGAAGMRAVACVVRNRVRHGWGDWDHVLTKKWQFSSLTATGDPELALWPDTGDPSFESAMEIAEGCYSGADAADPTNGALLYANLKVCTPAWLPRVRKVAEIGSHTFFV